jgi:carbon-monoxide dehydrogenase large subunit
VIYAGQPVAMVVAETEAQAEDAAGLVDVQLEPLEPVVDLEAAARTKCGPVLDHMGADVRPGW